MAHEFGGLTLPAAVAGPDDAATDPALGAVSQFFAAVLTKFVSAAWNDVAAKEPIVRTIKLANPEDCDFIQTDLPALYCWREPATPNDGYTDDHLIVADKLVVEWIPPPKTSESRLARWHPLANGIGKAIGFAVNRGYDPAWIHPADQWPPVSPAIAASAAAYGSQVRKFAGFSSWRLAKTERSVLGVESDGRLVRYVTFRAEITVHDVSVPDASKYGVADFSAPGMPGGVDVVLTTDPTDPLGPLTTQHGEYPIT